MKRVYCSKCNKITFQDLADKPRNKGNPICQVHPANDEAAEKTIEKQLAKKTAYKVSADKGGSNLDGYI